MRPCLALCCLIACGISLADEPKTVAEVGKPAPDFEITGDDGNAFKLSELTGAGKNVVLMFDRAHW